VGDAKYKLMKSDHAPNADLYQLLAYTIATVIATLNIWLLVQTFKGWMT